MAHYVQYVNCPESGFEMLNLKTHGCEFNKLNLDLLDRFLVSRSVIRAGMEERVDLCKGFIEQTNKHKLKLTRKTQGCIVWTNRTQLFIIFNE